MRFLPREDDVRRMRRYRDRHTVLWLATIGAVVALVALLTLIQRTS